MHQPCHAYGVWLTYITYCFPPSIHHFDTHPYLSLRLQQPNYSNTRTAKHHGHPTKQPQPQRYISCPFLSLSSSSLPSSLAFSLNPITQNSLLYHHLSIPLSNPFIFPSVLSLQKTPRPLLSISHDGLLPRRLLPRRPRRRRQPCRSRRADEGIPRFFRLAGQQSALHRPGAWLQVVFVHGAVEGGSARGQG